MGVFSIAVDVTGTRGEVVVQLIKTKRTVIKIMRWSNLTISLTLTNALLDLLSDLNKCRYGFTISGRLLFCQSNSGVGYLHKIFKVKYTTAIDFSKSKYTG